LKFLIEDGSISGPVNFVAPNAVTNAEFTKALGRVLSKPTLFPVPAFGARLAFGEMADALLLSSQRVKPGVLQHFAYPTLDAALRHILHADKRG
jgi:NAD dependent epimerase/dehydratase family enzyme